MYKETSGNVTTSAQSGTADNTAINELTVGGVTIGGTGGISGKIIAKNIVGIKNTGESTKDGKITIKKVGNKQGLKDIKIEKYFGNLNMGRRI